jgi:hypothetical protein
MRIPQGSGVVSNRKTSTGQVSTTATQTASNAFSGAMGIVQQWKTQKDNADTQEAINNAIRKRNEWKGQNLTREGKAAQGLTEDFIKHSQELDDEITAGLSNNAREAFKNWSTRDFENEKLGVMMYQKKQDEFVKQSAFKDGISVAEETIRTDAKSWQKGVEHLNTTLELGKNSGVIPEEQFETYKTEALNKYRSEIGKNYYTQDKHEFMKNINQFGFGKPEIEAYKQKYANDLAAEEREKKSLYAEEMRALRASVDDMKAQAVANGDTSYFKQAAEKAQSMGYKLEAKEFLEHAANYDKVIAFESQTKNMSLKEIEQQAAGLNVGSDLEGSSSELKANLAIKKEVEQKLKQFNLDPAKYVSAFATGETNQERADSLLSLQAAQGKMPKDGYKILTVDQKTQAKNIWEGGDVKDRVDLVMHSLTYGKHSSKVLGEMGINPTLSMSPMLIKDGNEKDVELLVAGLSHKPEILDEATKRDYADMAKSTSLYQHQAKVQARFPTNGELPQRVAQLEKAIVGISAVKVNPESGKEFFEDRLETMDEGDKLIYFPKTIDSDEISGFLDNKKREIESGLLKSGDNIQGRKVKMAMRNAVWVNSEDGGFVLADEVTGSFIPGSEVNLIETDGVRKDFISTTTKKFKEARERKDLMTSTFIRR